MSSLEEVEKETILTMRNPSGKHGSKTLGSIQHGTSPRLHSFFQRLSPLERMKELHRVTSLTLLGFESQNTMVNIHWALAPSQGALQDFISFQPGKNMRGEYLLLFYIQEN